MSNIYQSLDKVQIDTGHGAIGPFAGFHYQYYFYILRMLTMQSRDEKVGFEYRDDVDSESEGKLIYYQLKHTVNHSAEPKLTLCDPDLWKALKVWVDIVSKQKNKGVDIDQFLSNLNFVLVTNKNDEDNDFCNKIRQYKDKQIDFATIKQYMQKLHDDRKDPVQKDGEPAKVNKVKSYMHDILQSDELDIILNHVDFSFFTDDNLLDEIKFQVGIRGVPEERIDEATESLLGKVALELFPKIQNGEDVTMTVIEFGNLILRVLGQYRGAKFIAKRRIPFDLTEDLTDRIFRMFLKAKARMR